MLLLPKMQNRFLSFDFEWQSNFLTFALRFQNHSTGEMSEWLKEHAWKVCLRQKRNVGSNPTLSAFARRSSEYNEERRRAV